MSRPWMPLYVADYLRDTRKLTPAEHGAYLLLIMEYWTSGGLPGDDRQLARVVGMSSAEWRKAKPNVQGFFGNDWKSHKRIDAELAKSAEISSKRSASAKLKHSNSSANAQQEHTHAGATSQPQPQSPSQDQISEADASGADAPIDHRKRLFNEGLQKLATMTGKGPDACRSFVGKCLKAASDDAVTVLGLIEEAERNQAVDPSAWIVARLKPMENLNGRRTVHEAADDLLAKVRALDAPAPSGIRDGTGENPVRLLSSG